MKELFWILAGLFIVLEFTDQIITIELIKSPNIREKNPFMRNILERHRWLSWLISLFLCGVVIGACRVVMIFTPIFAVVLIAFADVLKAHPVMHNIKILIRRNK